MTPAARASFKVTELGVDNDSDEVSLFFTDVKYGDGKVLRAKVPKRQFQEMLSQMAPDRPATIMFHPDANSTLGDMELMISAEDVKTMKETLSPLLRDS